MFESGYYLVDNSAELLLWATGAAFISFLAGRFLAGRLALVVLYFAVLALILLQVYALFNDLNSEHPSWLFIALLYIPVLVFYTQHKYNKAGRNGKIILYGIFVGLYAAMLQERLIYYHFPNYKWGIAAWHVCTLSEMLVAAALLYPLVFYFFRKQFTWKMIWLAGLAGGLASMLYQSAPAINIYIRYSIAPVPFGTSPFEAYPITYQLAWRIPYFVFPQLAAALLTGWIFIVRQRNKKPELV